MTDQTKLALFGIATFAVTKLYFKRDLLTSGFAATSAMSLVALFRAKNTE